MRNHITDYYRALVTGGAGFMGSHLVEQLLKKGLYVTVLDNLSTGSLENIHHLKKNPRLRIIISDLRDYNLIQRDIDDVDVVFHVAANPEVRVSTIKPRVHFENNLTATFNLLEIMRIKDIDKLVFFSSSSVYGETEGAPVKEDNVINPVSIYGACKASCETFIKVYSELYGIKAICLRFANVIGPRLRHGVVYDFVLKLMKNPRRLEILGDGSQVRSYLHVYDAINATIIVLEKSYKSFEVYNIGNKDWLRVNDVANIVISAMGLGNVELIYKPQLHGIGWPGDVKRIIMDVTRIISLGWSPKMTSKEAIYSTVKTLVKELKI